MKLHRLLAKSAFIGISAVAWCALGSANADPVSYTGAVTVSYWDSNSFFDTGSNIAYFGNPYLTDSIGSINETRDIGGSDSDPNWPTADNVFAADFTATIDVAIAGNYTFKFGTDDAGYLFIDNVLVANQGGIHGIDIQPYTVFLAAGDHSLEVQYDNIFCCGAVALLALPAPEPDPLPLLGAGLAGLGALTVRRRRKLSKAA